MKALYAFSYLMRPDGEGVPEAVSEHVAHWHVLALEGSVGGPFEDRTGVTFRADDARIAEDAVASDPVVTGATLWCPGSSMGARNDRAGDDHGCSAAA